MLWEKLIQWTDTCPKRKLGTNKECELKTCDEKFHRLLFTRESWFIYAAFSENMTIRKDKRVDKDWDERVVQWDYTNVQTNKPNDGAIQKIPYSSYYD